MQFSIEVLPAPFGPMMARISLLRISKDTSVSAFTPPKPSETFSTASSTLPLARSGPSGALSGALMSLPSPSPSPLQRGRVASGASRERGRGRSRSPLSRPSLTQGPPSPAEGGRGQGAPSSRRLLQRRRLNRIGFHIPDRHPRRDNPLAAVLERDLSGDVGLGRAIVQRLNQRRVALGDEAAPD